MNKQKLSSVYGKMCNPDYEDEFECVALMYLTDDELLSLYWRTDNEKDYDARSYCITELWRRGYEYNYPLAKWEKEAETEEDLQGIWDYIGSIDDDLLKEEVLDNYYRTHDYVNGQYIPEDVMSAEIEEYERERENEYDVDELVETMLGGKK